MAESYCKWPAIIGIVIGSLIVISVIWCCARCLCCGAECCCGCLSCFNRCCPSPRRRNSGYEKPQSYPYNSQYQSPAPPMYFGAGYRAPQTATFDSPSNKNYNEDSLPAMPTWSTAQSRQVEDESVEMEKLDRHPSAQQQGLLHQRHESEDSIEQDGDIGRMQAGLYNQQAAPYEGQPNVYHEQNSYQGQANVYHEQNPYHEQANTYYGQVSPYQGPTSPHDYSQHQQFVGSPTSTAGPSMYPPAYNRPPSSVYTSPYAAPPSYRTAPPSIASPPPQHAQMNYGIGRKPVTGSWRDV